MGFLDSLKDTISNNIVLTVAGLGVVIVGGVAIYLAATDDETQPVIQEEKALSVYDRKIQALKVRFNTQNIEDIKELVTILQAAIQEQTNKMQEEFRSKRMAAKGKGLGKYFEVINDGLSSLGIASTQIQNKIFGQFGITEEQFEMLCQKNPAIISLLYESQAQQPGGKLLTLDETRNLIDIQRKFLINPKLVDDLKEATENLPREVLDQIPVYIAIMLSDHIDEKTGHNEATINRSIMTHGGNLMKDLQEQQMLINRVVTQVLSASGAMGGFPPGMGFDGSNHDFMDQMGNSGQLASMMGLDPEMMNQAMMSGDKDMMAKMMEMLNLGNK